MIISIILHLIFCIDLQPRQSLQKIADGEAFDPHDFTFGALKVSTTSG